jgi:hypothetical protein
MSGDHPQTVAIVDGVIVGRGGACISATTKTFSKVFRGASESFRVGETMV